MHMLISCRRHKCRHANAGLMLRSALTSTGTKRAGELGATHPSQAAHHKEDVAEGITPPGENDLEVLLVRCCADRHFSCMTYGSCQTPSFACLAQPSAHHATPG